MESPTIADRKAALLVSAVGGLLAGLCCLAPIVMVSLGLTSVAIANNWGNLLYGEYKWWFRLGALALVGVTLALYLRSRGICSLDQAIRQRNRIINLVLLTLVTFAGVYIFWVYIVLHAWGVAAGLPWAQWDESWAIPASILLLGIMVAAYVVLPKLANRRRGVKKPLPEPAPVSRG